MSWPLAVTVHDVYSYVWGIFSSEDASVLREQRTNNVMDNSSASNVGTVPAKVNCGGQ